MVIPYITFAGECGGALAFYAGAFNTKAERVQTYGTYVPEGVSIPPENLNEWILHAEMEICGTILWFADEIAEPVTKGTMVKLTATAPTAEDARRIFEALVKGAHVTLPPTETFYSTFHGGLVDKFGVCWNITAEELPKKP